MQKFKIGQPVKIVLKGYEKERAIIKDIDGSPETNLPYYVSCVGGNSYWLKEQDLQPTNTETIWLDGKEYKIRDFTEEYDGRGKYVAIEAVQISRKQMTHQEIEKELGYSVEIVKGK